jgi:hypothetical protein
LRPLREAEKRKSDGEVEDLVVYPRWVEVEVAKG